MAGMSGGVSLGWEPEGEQVREQEAVDGRGAARDDARQRLAKPYEARLVDRIAWDEAEPRREVETAPNVLARIEIDRSRSAHLGLDEGRGVDRAGIHHAPPQQSALRQNIECPEARFRRAGPESVGGLDEGDHRINDHVFDGADALDDPRVSARSSFCSPVCGS